MATVQSSKSTSRSVGLMAKRKPVKKASTKRVIKKAVKKIAKKIPAKKKVIKKIASKNKPVKKTVAKKIIKKVLKKKPIKKLLKKKPIKKILKKKPIKKVLKKKPVKKILKKVAKKLIAPSYTKQLNSFRKTIRDLRECYKKIEGGFRDYASHVGNVKDPISFISGMDAKFQKQFSSCACKPAAKGKSPNVYGKPACNYLSKEMKKWPAKYNDWQKKSKKSFTQAKDGIKKAHSLYKQADKFLKDMKKIAKDPSPMFFRFEGQLKIFAAMNKCYEKHGKSGFC